MQNVYIKLWVITMAVVLACFLFFVILKPIVLEKMCLINTGKCVQMSYKKLDDSVLIHLQPTGYWIWFDGKDILLYGLPTGRICMDEGYEPAYVVDVKNKQILGYYCAKTLEHVIKFYEDNNSAEQYIFTRNEVENFDIYAALNLLIEKRVITI